MKILFMGTPDIAAECLRSLVLAGMNVVGAVSQPDKPKGRGHKLSPTDVKIAAEENGIPVFQPKKLKNGELIPVLDELKPDIIAVVAYGKLLPEYIISYPKYGCINVHASLLPKLRGAAPIQWAIINGEKKTGITTMLMDNGLDTGDMLLRQEIEIGEYETSEDLFVKMAKLGGDLLVKTIKNIKSITPVPQNHEEQTYAPIIKKDMAHINWSKSTNEISNLICGMNSWPMAYSYYHDNLVKIITARKGEPVNGKNGQIIGFEKGRGLRIKTCDGSIYIVKAQFPNSKRMGIDEYLRGHKIDYGTILK
ncbi:MAG: methionyl-tRNA formyltransferase [Firmicutes bacterium]|nr:methionyl-tRNA formyltransferase [Bacillota bacterium]